jgi:hypothetical protein
VAWWKIFVPNLESAYNVINLKSYFYFMLPQLYWLV